MEAAMGANLRTTTMIPKLNRQGPNYLRQRWAQFCSSGMCHSLRQKMICELCAFSLFRSDCHTLMVHTDIDFVHSVRYDIHVSLSIAARAAPVALASFAIGTSKMRTMLLNRVSSSVRRPRGLILFVHSLLYISGWD